MLVVTVKSITLYIYLPSSSSLSLLSGASLTVLRAYFFPSVTQGMEFGVNDWTKICHMQSTLLTVLSFHILSLFSKYFYSSQDTISVYTVFMLILLFSKPHLKFYSISIFCKRQSAAHVKYPPPRNEKFISLFSTKYFEVCLPVPYKWSISSKSECNILLTLFIF